MVEIFKELKKIAVTLLILDFLITVITLIAGWFNLSVFLGMVYGFVFTQLMLILLGTDLKNALDMSEKSAIKYMRIHYAIRFVMTFIILVIPFSSGKINGWCVALALLSPKFTYFAIGFYETFRERRR